MSASQTHFQHAHHFEVHNGQFTNITNTTVVNENDAVTTILWPHVSGGAIFDSAARYAAGKCHPGTRTKVIGSIIDWIKGLNTPHSLLWLYGAAGAGKSAIAHTICELLKQSHPDIYGGSFFFASGNSDRGHAHKLFATLSYQLAIHFPPMRQEINDALAHDPSLPTKSMEIQLFSLIIQPLLRSQQSLSQRPVLIIDGLDECAETEGSTQSDIIALIGNYMAQHSNPCLRVIIASRPEYWIRDIFETPSLTGITLPLSLRDDVHADRDIKAYLVDGFEKIRVENKRTMGSVVPPWPSVDVIERLVYEASGQYIYAATVLKFVGKSSRFHNPQEQLRIITSVSSGPHRASAFSELDALYAKILSVYPRWQIMKRVLAAHLIEDTIPILAIQTVLCIDPPEFLMVLDALSSLIDIKRTEPPQNSEGELVEKVIGDLLDTRCDIMSFCHRSFGEFLQDQTRSGSFHIHLDSDPVPNEILSECFDMICRNIDQSYQVKPYDFLNIAPSTYICMKELMVAATSYCNFTTLQKLLIDMTAALGRFDPVDNRVTGMGSLFSFMHDAGYLEEIAAPPLSRRYLPAERHTIQQPDESSDKLTATRQKFREAINQACQRAYYALPSCTDFKATPALVYLLEYHLHLYGFPFYEQFFIIAGVSDAVLEMRKYGYTIPVRYKNGAWWTDNMPLPWLFDNGEEPGWRIEGVWRDLRVTLAHRSLKEVLKNNNCGNDSTMQLRYVDGLSEFFETREISDICTIEYFQNSNNLALLSAITDLASRFHLHLLHNQIHASLWPGPDSRKALHPLFHWVNRHLTNPHTVSLLRGYDEALQETLTAFMGDLFDYIFLRPLLYYNGTGLRAYPHDYRGTWIGKHVQIHVQPLPWGLHCEQSDPIGIFNASSAHNALALDYWQRFHDENFGNLETVKDTSIIDPSRWCPHLASGLLKLLVSGFYALIHPGFLQYWDDDHKGYLTQCMPYAQPTRENLDALRAIVYLYPQVTNFWRLPEGLWPLFVEFLHKYDRSILSSEELDLFLKWLNSEEHSDIKTYVEK